MTVATHDPHWAQVGKNRVAKLMRKACLRGLSNGPYPEGTQRPATRRRYVVTTERNKRERLAPDLVNRKFIATAPNQLWVAECWVPCDHVPVRSWPLFRARQLMRDVIESFKQDQAL